jgi:WD40 repeat protein
MSAILITFTLTCLSTSGDYALIQGMLMKTADFLPPEETVRLQRTDTSVQMELEDLEFSLSPMILTASADNTAKLWSAETGELIRSFEGHTRLVRSAVFSKDGDRVLTASHDNTAKVWNAETGELIRSFEGHTNQVWSAVFSKDGNRVLTASSDNTAKLWNAETGELRAVSSIFERRESRSHCIIR